MITVQITQDFETTGEAVRALHHIAGLIEEGYTSGFHPSWDMEGEEEA